MSLFTPIKVRSTVLRVVPCVLSIFSLFGVLSLPGVPSDGSARIGKGKIKHEGVYVRRTPHRLAIRPQIHRVE